MRTLGIIAVAIGLVGTIAVGSAVPAAADWYGHHHNRYYNYYGGAHGTAARRIGLSRAAPVSPIRDRVCGGNNI
jgi:hypothetical protein